MVATAVGGTPEAVEDAVNGYLVPPGDPPALAQRILDALSDELRRQAMAQRGRKRVLHEFSFENRARHSCGCFRNCRCQALLQSNVASITSP